MQPGFVEARPPYLEFERRVVERRKSAEEGGETYYVEIDFVIITPIGSKDRIDKVAVEWLDNLRAQVRNDRYPEAWLESHKKAYEAFKSNQEIPLDGTPIRTWPAVSPNEVRALLAWNVRTVEDLAQANEETVGRIGMGGRALKQRAVDWMASKSDHGSTVSQMEALRATNEMLGKRLAALEQELRQRPAGSPQVAQPVASLESRLEAAQAAAAVDDDNVLDRALS